MSKIRVSTKLPDHPYYLAESVFYFNHQSVPVAENSYMSTSGFVIAGDNVQAASILLSRFLYSFQGFHSPFKVAFSIGPPIQSMEKDEVQIRETLSQTERHHLSPLKNIVHQQGHFS